MAQVVQGTSQSIPNGAVWTTITNLTSEYIDNNNIHDNVTNNSRLTAQTAGTYRVKGTISYSAPPSGSALYAILYRNGGQSAFVGSVGASSSANQYVSVTGILTLNVGDYVELYGAVAGPSAVNTNPSTTTFEMFRIDGGFTNSVAGGSGVTTVGGLDGGTANAAGATISGTTMFLQSASATMPGLINTTTQTFAGAKTFSNLITGNAGISVSGATIDFNVASNNATNINTGTSTGLVTIGGGSGTFSLQTTNIDISSAGAISGVTGYAQTSGNFLQSGAGTFGTGTGAVSLNGAVSASSTIDVTGSFATKKGTDYSTVGTTNNVNFGDTSLVRLTGASAQTITGIAGGRDGERLTIINAAAQMATLSNGSASSLAANRITTGTGADVSLVPNGSAELVYDSGASVWRIVGAVTSGGVPMAKAYNLADSSIANGIWSLVALDSEEYDNNAIHDTVTNNTRLTAKTAGYYKITGKAAWTTNTTGSRHVALWVNANPVSQSNTNTLSSTMTYIGDTAVVKYLNVNDYVELVVYQSSGANLNLMGGSNNTFIDMYRIDGGFTNSAAGGITTVGALDGGTANSTGATINGSSIFLQSASFTQPGLVNTTTQTFAGNKMFRSTINSSAAFAVQNSSGNSILLVDTTNTDARIEIANNALANDTSKAQLVIQGGSDPTLGPLLMLIGTRPSATGANRYGYISTGDLAAMRNLVINTNGAGAYGTVSIGTTTPIGSALTVVGPNSDAGVLSVSNNSMTLYVSPGRYWNGTSMVDDNLVTGLDMAGLRTLNVSDNLRIVGSGGTCTINGSGSCTSDARLKDVHGVLTNSLAKISQLQPVYYTWKDHSLDQNMNLGLLAQDVQAQFPELVTTDFATGNLMLNYAGLVTPLIGAVQEQQGQIGSIASAVSGAQAQLANLTSSVAALQSIDLTHGGTVHGNIVVNGNLAVSGEVTISGKVSTGDIYVNGHIATRGAAPSVAAGVALGQGVLGISTTNPVAGVDGTDTAGTVTVTAGAQNVANGVLAHIGFAKAFDTSYKVVVSASNDHAADLRLYVVKTATGFDVVSRDPVTAGTQYTIDYIVLGATN